MCMKVYRDIKFLLKDSVGASVARNDINLI